jgi:hypothetical protein
VSVPCAEPSIYGNPLTDDRSCIPRCETVIYVTHVYQRAIEDSVATEA